MSNKQPVLNAKQLAKALKKKGFVFEHQSGSHAVYINSNNIRVTVPMHGTKDIGKGLLSQILIDANITIDELKKLI